MFVRTYIGPVIKNDGFLDENTFLVRLGVYQDNIDHYSPFYIRKVEFLVNFRTAGIYDVAVILS